MGLTAQQTLRKKRLVNLKRKQQNVSKTKTKTEKQQRKKQQHVLCISEQLQAAKYMLLEAAKERSWERELKNEEIIAEHFLNLKKTIYYQIPKSQEPEAQEP